MFENINKVGVSVVIVTYNGKDKLKPTLEHLANQQAIDFDWEILVIDNNSNDGTSEYVSNFWNNLGCSTPLRIIQEPIPGTMYARYNGILNANLRYILYCDDDNWLHPTYIKIAFNTICENNKIAVVGGIGVPFFEEPNLVPGWLNNHIKLLGCGPQGKSDGDTTFDKGCLYTAGAILDRVWLNKLYKSDFKSILKGRDSKSVVAGEDTELTYALRLIGGKLYYNSKMKFNHFMPINRTTYNYLKKLNRGIGYSNNILKSYIDNSKKSFITDLFFTSLLLLKYSCLKFLNYKNDRIQYSFYKEIFKGKLLSLNHIKKTNLIIENWKNTVNRDL